MELRWTQEAAADLERIADYLFEHTPDHAERLVRALYEAPATLLTFPRTAAGWAGSRAHVSSSCRPCLIVVYTLRVDAVYVVRILHGAQQWP